ncbi:MAG: archaellin/type IV pilin N-terminal domain-containing protein [Nitrososphaerales archaeon]
MRLTKRRAVSPVIAELLLIVITVAIGTLVYSFASTAFGGFGAGFSNLVQNAGGQLTENVVIEQVTFLHNSTGNAGTCPVATECSGDIFIGNSGSNTAVITGVFVTNVTGNSAVSSRNFEFFAYNPLPVDKYNIGPLPMLLASCSVSCFVSIAPGQTVMLRFFTSDPAVPGSTYAFTFITGRGNQIVAYEKA